MTMNEVYIYLKKNGLPVTLHDDNTRIRLDGSTAALDTVLFTKVYEVSDSQCLVGSSPSVMLAKATYYDLDNLINSYLEHCDLDRIKRVRSARLRYAIDNHNGQTP